MNFNMSVFDMIVDMENIKVIFLDIDNTLLDFDACIHQALFAGFKEFGLGEFNEDMFKVFQRINIAMWQSLERGEIDLAELKRRRFNAVFKELGISFDGMEFEKWFRTFIYDCVIPVDGAYELLEALKDKYTLCTASNGPEQQQLHRMELSKIDRYLSFQFVSEALKVSKPSKAFFDKALEIMGGVKPDECLIIGDSLSSDIQGGINAGMKTVFFNKHYETDLKGIKPDYAFNTLEEIKEFLK